MLRTLHAELKYTTWKHTHTCVPHADTQRMIEIWRAVWGVRGWWRANGMKQKRNQRAPHTARSLEYTYTNAGWQTHTSDYQNEVLARTLCVVCRGEGGRRELNI